MAFKKGTSGNPKGRPKGITTKAVIFRKAVQDSLFDVIDAVVTAAKAGDVQAAKIVLDKSFPNVRAVAAPEKFKLDSTASLSDQARAVLQSVASGSMSPDTGSLMLTGIEKTARVIESTELAERVQKLEADYESQQ